MLPGLLGLRVDTPSSGSSLLQLRPKNSTADDDNGSKSSSSTTASTNLFDAAFKLNRLRTASCSSGHIPVPCASVQSEAVCSFNEKSDESLNTPQIFSAKISSDETLNTPQIFPSLQDVVSLPVTPAIEQPSVSRVS